MRSRLCVLAAMATLAGASAAFAQQVENPTYKAWAAYKPGTSITRKTVTITDMPAPFESTTTEKLVKVTAESVVIETTMTMLNHGQELKLPGTEVTISATLEKDQVGLPNQALANKPKVLEVKEGKEMLEIKGKKVETSTRAFKTQIAEDGETMATQIKTWFALEVPGGLVQSELTSEKPVKVNSKTTLVDFSIVK